MILHFVTDEKFIDMASREFEAVAPGRNRFLMLAKPYKLRYIRNTAVEFVSRRACKRLLGKGDYSGICLHNLYSGSAVLRYLPAGKKVVWFGWGFDYYNGPLSSPEVSRSLFLPQTQALISQLKARSEVSPRLIARRLRGLLLKSMPARSRAPLERIDYFSPVLDVEFAMVKERNPWFRAEHVPWSYGTVEDDFSLPGGGVRATGTDLLVGNSSSAPNNHLEIFDWLRGRDDLGNRKIIVPLSYGNEQYRVAVIAAGRELLGDRFVPLSEFQPIEQYLETVSRCGFVFMNHLRQQAVGTVVIALLAGAKLFLNASNPLFEWLRARGAVVFDPALIRPDSSENALVFQPLGENEKQRNKEVVMAHWGREAQKEKTRKVVQLIGDYDGESTIH